MMALHHFPKRMSPPLRSVSSSWRFAIIGALASLPITVLVDSLPDSEANVTGGVMIFGGFIAGVLAARRSTDPEAAGFRVGLLAIAIGLLTSLVAAIWPLTESTVIAWPSLSEMAFLAFLGVVALVLVPSFSLVCGRIGGWVATTVTARWTTTPS